MLGAGKICLVLKDKAILLPKVNCSMDHISIHNSEYNLDPNIHETV
jgi:hypothetical protein